MRRNYCRGSFSNVDKAPSLMIKGSFSSAKRLLLLYRKGSFSNADKAPSPNAVRLPPPSRSLMTLRASYLE